jgi:hypothetical protein
MRALIERISFRRRHTAVLLALAVASLPPRPWQWLGRSWRCCVCLVIEHRLSWSFGRTAEHGPARRRPCSRSAPTPPAPLVPISGSPSRFPPCGLRFRFCSASLRPPALTRLGSWSWPPRLPSCCSRSTVACLHPGEVLISLGCLQGPPWISRLHSVSRYVCRAPGRPGGGGHMTRPSRSALKRVASSSCSRKVMPRSRSRQAA